MPFLAITICLVACHGGPADHFATFAESLSKHATIEIHASGPALDKFQQRGVEVKHPFSINSHEGEEALAEKIAKDCSLASVVITDVGHRFDVKIQQALSNHAAHVLRLAYYDNPEPYVPGGYSKVAAEVMLSADRILFGNANLTTTPIFQTPGTEIDFGNRKKVGIGYYPLNQVENTSQRRTTEHLSIRETLFDKGVVENSQKIWVYFGGNNEEYFTKAFPAFLKLLEEGIKQIDLSNFVIVIQQHPGAQSENKDTNMALAWMSNQSENAPKMIISDFTPVEAQIVADAALYYQTSMAPQFVLAGIPTIQIGHEPFEDILVRNQLSPSVTDVVQFLNAIDSLSHSNKLIPQEIVLDALGIKDNWRENLLQATKPKISDL